MHGGTVKAWVARKGFGFVVPDEGGNDLFVHVSELINSQSLSPGDKVTFETGLRNGKLQAKGCKVISNEQADEQQKSCGDLIDEDHTSAKKGESLVSSISFPRADSQSFEASVASFLEVAGRPHCTTLETFLCKSSLGCPFLVVSETQLVDSIRAPENGEFQFLWDLTMAYISGCEACGAMMIADFEGEILGYGGEMVTGAFQVTDAVDKSRLTPCSANSDKPLKVGLLIDMRSSSGSTLVKKIMESSSITKLMWGADADFQSLMYQILPRAFNIEPADCVDVQLAFSTDSRRLGMSKMLDEVPRGLMVDLPSKEQVHWDSFHCQNRRALPLPLSSVNALYAIDDLHRIEAILRSQKPLDGNYQQAYMTTNKVLSEIREDPCGLRQLKKDFGRLRRVNEVKKIVVAVKCMRHVLSLPARGADHFLEDPLVCQVKSASSDLLSSAGVVIPADLSFSSDNLSKTSQESEIMEDAKGDKAAGSADGNLEASPTVCMSLEKPKPPDKFRRRFLVPVAAVTVLLFLWQLIRRRLRLQRVGQLCP